jgi:hypothetical protein
VPRLSWLPDFHCDETFSSLANLGCSYRRERWHAPRHSIPFFGRGHAEGRVHLVEWCTESRITSVQIVWRQFSRRGVDFFPPHAHGEVPPPHYSFPSFAIACLHLRLGLSSFIAVSWLWRRWKAFSRVMMGVVLCNLASLCDSQLLHACNKRWIIQPAIYYAFISKWYSWEWHCMWHNEELLFSVVTVLKWSKIWWVSHAVRKVQN